jgi:hypothetical protein
MVVEEGQGTKLGKLSCRAARSNIGKLDFACSSNWKGRKLTAGHPQCVSISPEASTTCPIPTKAFAFPAKISEVKIDEHRKDEENMPAQAELGKTDAEIALEWTTSEIKNRVAKGRNNLKEWLDGYMMCMMTLVWAHGKSDFDLCGDAGGYGRYWVQKNKERVFNDVACERKGNRKTTGPNFEFRSYSKVIVLFLTAAWKILKGSAKFGKSKQNKNFVASENVTESSSITSIVAVKRKEVCWCAPCNRMKAVRK